MTTDCISVVIADDHPIFVEGMSAILARHPEFTVSAVASTGVEALGLAEQLTPTTMLMDIGMPSMDGLEATRRIIKTTPQTAILILTMESGHDVHTRAAQAGARGLLRKDDHPSAIIEALRTVAGGGVWFQQGPKADDFEEQVFHRLKILGLRAKLTPRENEVLRLLVLGRNTAEIAELCGITARAAKFHQSNVIKKVGADSRTDLFRVLMCTQP